VGYVIDAEAHGADGQGSHYVRKRWRSDDPWGAIMRALYDAIAYYLPREVDVRKEQNICAVTLFVKFSPDAEDAELLKDPAWLMGARPVPARQPPWKGGC
jgi:hypothetical protein